MCSSILTIQDLIYTHNINKQRLEAEEDSDTDVVVFFFFEARVVLLLAAIYML